MSKQKARGRFLDWRDHPRSDADDWFKMETCQFSCARFLTSVKENFELLTIRRSSTAQILESTIKVIQQIVDIERRIKYKYRRH